MEEVTIYEGENGLKITLTTESELSMHGLPIMRIKGPGRRLPVDFRPFDKLWGMQGGEVIGMALDGLLDDDLLAYEWSGYLGNEEETLEISKRMEEQLSEGRLANTNPPITGEARKIAEVFVSGWVEVQRDLINEMNRNN